MVVEFHQNAKGFKRGEKAVVVAGSVPTGKAADFGHETGLYLLTNGSCPPLPVTQTNRFEVYRTRDMEEFCLTQQKGIVERLCRQWSFPIHGHFS
jgi:hypothetical protein